MTHIRMVAMLRGVAFAVAFSVSLAQAGPIELKVMTQNLYVGADIGKILTADPNIPPGVIGSLPWEAAQAWNNVLATNAAARMARVAQQIKDEMPHIVGLQEVSVFRTGLLGGPLTTTIDFLDLLNQSLAGLGVSYSVVTGATAINTVSPVVALDLPPALGGTGTLFPPLAIELTDKDAILVRNDLPLNEFKLLSGGATDMFDFILQVPIGGNLLPIGRSYGYVDVEMAGIKLRAFNTHLEALVPIINELQALELIAATNASPYRQVLLGDFNTIAEGGVPTLTDEFIMGAGFSDAWLDKGAGPGFTWGHDAALNDPLRLLDERLDYVFHRGGFTTLDVDVIGLAPGVGQPLWASDHAGVVAILQVVPAPGTALLIVIALGALAVTRRRAAA